MRKYAKAWVAILGATLASVSVVYGDAPWLTVLTTFITAYGVYMVPNLSE